MVSIYNLIKDLIRIIAQKLFRLPPKKNIIVIRRFPPRKILRGHQFGLTFGLISALIFIYFNYSILFSEPFPFLAPLIAAVFVVGTLFSNPFVILVGIFLLFHLLIFSPSIQLWTALYESSRYYIWSYAFGAVLATLYNDLVYIHLRVFRRDSVKLSFAFDVDKKINIIKSPDEREETALLQILKPLIYYTQCIKKNDRPEFNAEELVLLIKRSYKRMKKIKASDDRDLLIKKLIEIGVDDISDDNFNEKIDKLKDFLLNDDFAVKNKAIEDTEEKIEPLVEKYLKLKSRKQFNFRVKNYSTHPYTIAFVANPKVLTSGKKAQVLDNSDFDNDPIIKNIKIFLNSIDNALFSFETNEVIGRREIWSQIRIIAIFDEKLTNESGIEYGLVQPYPDQAIINGVVVSNLLYPLDNMWTNYQNILHNCNTQAGFAQNELQNIIDSTDVIFAMSSSELYNRSTALYTDFGENGEKPVGKSVPFHFDLDPHKTKTNKISLPPRAVESKGLIISEHEPFAKIPGRVALNVLGASLKSYVHEFAHAMSSATHGAIDDEYYDRKEMTKKIEFTKIKDDEKHKLFYVNRINRKKDGIAVPVPREFAKYNKNLYHSDREHPSAREDWVGYFPERKCIHYACIMDRHYGAYRFDELISQFMYDRLIAKINR